MISPRKLAKLAVTFFLTVCLACVGASAIYLASNEGVGGVNMRALPEGTVLLSVPQGATCVVMQDGVQQDAMPTGSDTFQPSGVADTVNEWWLVMYNGEVGYVRGEYLTAQPDGEVGDLGRAQIDSIGTIHARIAPTSAAIGTFALENAAWITILGVENGWYYIEADGQRGYIQPYYVAFAYVRSGDCEAEVAAVMEVARTYLGTPYLMGGKTYAGIDCSALIQNVFEEALNYSLPRTASGQSLYGLKIESIDDLQEGDLVFFGSEDAIDHVGIYAGFGAILHAPQTGYVVQYNNFKQLLLEESFQWGCRLILPLE